MKPPFRMPTHLSLWQPPAARPAVVCPECLDPFPLWQPFSASLNGRDAVELLGRKPGLSGLWQVMGRSRLGYEQRRRLDLFMLRNWSASLYLTILFKTFRTVLTGTDAW